MAIRLGKPRTRSPFRGKPTTWPLSNRDGSPRGFRIKLNYLTPWRAKIADGLAVASTGGAMLGGFYAASSTQPQDDVFIIAATLAPMALYRLFKLMHRHDLRKTTIVEVTRDHFRINGVFGWKTYDRNIPHRFAILQHDKAQREWEGHELEARKAAMKGKVLNKTKYYQESWHVVFDYALQRIDIADVLGIKEARAIQARLAGCAQVMDALAGAGPGPVMTSEQEWREGPGGIPA